MCVSDLCLVLDRDQSTVSRHLRVLDNAGLVWRRVEHRYAWYQLTNTGRQLFEAISAEVEEPVRLPDRNRPDS